jgi:hypothetical protein
MPKKTDTLNLGGFEYTRAELRTMMRDARKAWDDAAARTPSAVAVKYDHPTKSVSVTLSNRCRLIVPLTLLPELRQGTPKQLADVVLEPDGIGIEWPQLDQQFLVSHLLADVCGPGVFMQELGRRGGQTTSRAKTKAARQNGLPGGRPRKRRSGKTVVS